MATTAQDRERVAHFLENYYDAMETNDPARYSAYYAEDITLTFGNEAPIHGRQAVTEAFDGVLSRFRSLQHELVNVWSEAAGVVIFESIGTWNLHGGESVSVPACSVFTIRGDRLTDLRIYVDNGPVFAALEQETR
ncbi:nuclear transport factor 2 family protein [Microbacterium sp. DT81.1]|uniref:nuclear transport factor 2 family protein n=1 Tax=Microbacterium sp. DT81.1 TaxID=3393413 RepID=UPI003CE6E633